MLRSLTRALVVGAFFAVVGSAVAGVPTTPISLSKPPTGSVDRHVDAAASSDGFVVTWTRIKTDATGNSVRVRAYTAAGKPSKAEVVIASGPNTLVGFSRILPLGSGKFMIVWRDMTQLYGAIYTLSTNTVSTKKPLVPSNEQLTDLVKLADGNVGLVTSGYKPGTTEYYVTVSIITKTLAVKKGPTPVHSSSYVGFNTVGLDYAVANTTSGGVVLRYDRVDGQVYAQRFGSSGALVGSQVKVNTTVNQSGSLFERVYRTVRATRLSNGKIFVAWASLEGNPFIDGLEIRGRYLDSSGLPTGPEIHVNAVAAGKQTLPEVLALSAGQVLAAFASETPPAQSTVFRVLGSTGKLGTTRTIDTNADGAIGLDTDLSLLPDGSVVNVYSNDTKLMAEGIPATQLK